MTNVITNKVLGNAAPLQEHEGANGVNAEAASKMRPSAKAYQLGKPIKNNTGNGHL